MPPRRSCRPSHARPRAAVALAVTLGLAAAACSSGSDSGSPLADDGRATAPSAPATAVEALKPYVGKGFYEPPTPLPAGPHGTLIRYQAMPALKIGASTTYRILYLSESVQGKRIAVSGMAVVPTAKAPKDGRKLLTIAHGTTGIADECAPSRSPKASEISLTGPAVDDGFLIAMSDYEG